MPRMNFTGRRRIAHRDVVITVTGIGGIELFDACIRLERYDLPPAAAVVVEAWRQLDLVRFDFGTVGSLVPPADRQLSSFGTVTGLRFRLKVVSHDPPRGRLLAVADRLTPATSHQQTLSRVPLLAVRSHDLGKEIWKLTFADEPVLTINTRIAPRKQLVASAEFQSLVLPEVLRSILSRILLVEQVREADTSDDWTFRWLQFAESLPGVGQSPKDDDPEADLEWIDSAVSSFCRWRSVDRQFAGFWTPKQMDEKEP